MRGSNWEVWRVTWLPCLDSCPERMAALVRRIVRTTKAPGAIGPYSQAVVVDRTMYISGQLGLDPATGQLVTGGTTQEAKQALVNMGEILKAANCNYNNVVKTTVLLADISDFNCVNDVYKQYFTTNVPARAAYQVAALPRGGRVEIEAVAVLGPIVEGALEQKL
ncbi:2-iminobutanoate/2-iminopropanoate deaminase isoform X1 [Scyliorhinus canicula]|uniref:2-iminobutanoate/2-iminopropanoate deaminase isoform X1 n=1 Tax=Scyliorhinus canicula TaxID=7830 RepID=UPI0018F47460|nr:2-iminobutanoate/2-iminopropanoate deaminase isoform X1 [Scyliorhinus canicula]